MAPRSYDLGQRATTVAVTRRRIMDAATALYRERGVAATSLAAVAERADVARGTIVNHFASADGLLAAVLEEAIALIEIPDERVLVGSRSRAERIHRFVDAIVRFNERSNSWWEVFRNDLELPAVRTRQIEFDDAMARLRRAALGPAATDRIVSAGVGALMDWRALWLLRDAGLSVEETVDVIAGLIGDLVRRSAAYTKASEGVMASGERRVR